MSVESGALSSVVKDDWLVDVPENATEGTPSFAASVEAPLHPISASAFVDTEEGTALTQCQRSGRSSRG